MTQLSRNDVISRLHTTIRKTQPTARTILYGSSARNEARPDSDIDILILLNKEHISPQEEEMLTAPIYDLEVESGIIISPIIMTTNAWENAGKQTTLYYRIKAEGKEL